MSVVDIRHSSKRAFKETWGTEVFSVTFKKLRKSLALVNIIAQLLLLVSLSEFLAEEEEEEIGSDTNLSEIDDADLMIRLEAKYGKLTGDESSEDEDPDYQSWTSIVFLIIKLLYIHLIPFVSI